MVLLRVPFRKQRQIGPNFPVNERRPRLFNKPKISFGFQIISGHWIDWWAHLALEKGGGCNSHFHSFVVLWRLDDAWESAFLERIEEAASRAAVRNEVAVDV